MEMRCLRGRRVVVNCFFRTINSISPYFIVFFSIISCVFHWFRKQWRKMDRCSLCSKQIMNILVSLKSPQLYISISFRENKTRANSLWIKFKIECVRIPREYMQITFFSHLCLYFSVCTLVLPYFFHSNAKYQMSLTLSQFQICIVYS